MRGLHIGGRRVHEGFTYWGETCGGLYIGGRRVRSLHIGGRRVGVYILGRDV